MNHRVKNLFSIISGMVRIAGHSAETVPDLVEGVTARIGALARSHNLTHRAPAGTRLTLTDAVEGAVEPYAGHASVTVDGPAVPLTPETLTTLSLMFHELATNTAKYGVLGAVDGSLNVSWSLEHGSEVVLDWTERYDVPAVKPSKEKKGFGSTLMQMSAAQLDGRIEVEQTEWMRRTRLNYENKK